MGIITMSHNSLSFNSDSPLYWIDKFNGSIRVDTGYSTRSTKEFQKVRSHKMFIVF